MCDTERELSLKAVKAALDVLGTRFVHMRLKRSWAGTPELELWKRRKWRGKCPPLIRGVKICERFPHSTFDLNLGEELAVFLDWLDGALEELRDEWRRESQGPAWLMWRGDDQPGLYCLGADVPKLYVDMDIADSSIRVSLTAYYRLVPPRREKTRAGVCGDSHVAENG